MSAYVQEMGWRDSCAGPALYIKIRRQDGAPMGWSEVWETFSDRYPGQYAIEIFPPADDLVDDANIYHLFVLESAPAGFEINGWRPKYVGFEDWNH